MGKMIRKFAVIPIFVAIIVIVVVVVALVGIASAILLAAGRVVFLMCSIPSLGEHHFFRKKGSYHASACPQSSSPFSPRSNITCMHSKV